MDSPARDADALTSASPGELIQLIRSLLQQNEEYRRELTALRACLSLGRKRERSDRQGKVRKSQARAVPVAAPLPSPVRFEDLERELLRPRRNGGGASPVMDAWRDQK